MNSIFHRVSIRKYQDKPIEDEKMEMLLRAAMAGPSAHNQQPWEYYVITNKEMCDVLSKVHKYSGPCKGAAAVCVACYRNDCIAPDYFTQDMGASVENFLLEADHQGLGAVWMGIAPEKERMEAVREIVGIPAHLSAFALIAVGYPAEERPQQDRYERERVHYIR